MAPSATSAITMPLFSRPTGRHPTLPARGSPIRWPPSCRRNSMLEWLGQRDGNKDAARAAARIEAAVDAVTGRSSTPDLSSPRTTGAVGDAAGWPPSPPRPAPPQPIPPPCARSSSTGMAATYEDSWPEPVAGPGEVVRVHACALDPASTSSPARACPGSRAPLPHITGGDVAGVVASVGAGVQWPHVGDRVVLNPSWGCGVCEYSGTATSRSACASTCWARWTRRPGRIREVPRPARRSPSPSTTRSRRPHATITFGTAWRMLVTHARVRPAGRGRVRSAPSAASASRRSRSPSSRGHASSPPPRRRRSSSARDGDWG